MKKRVLVVDDFENSRFVIEFSLKQKGFDVITAASGQQALQKLSYVNPDIIVTDFNMPEMTGLQLVREIKALPEYAHVPIIVLSTETSEDKKNETYKAGITAWVRKPFKMEDFMRIIEKSSAMLKNEGEQ